MNRTLTIVKTENKKQTTKTVTLPNFSNFIKAETIFEMLNNFEHSDNEEENTSIYHIEKTTIISAYRDGTFSSDMTLFNLYRDGYELCSENRILTHIDNIISIRCRHKNKILKLDFTGQIDNTNDKYYAFTLNCESEHESNEIFNELTNKYDYDYTYAKNEFPVEAHRVLLQKHNGMIEIFSNLIEPECFQSDFGVNQDYCERCIAERNRMLSIAKDIENEYNNVKTFVSDWNDGCENGCALYIYIL